MTGVGRGFTVIVISLEVAGLVFWQVSLDAQYAGDMVIIDQ